MCRLWEEAAAAKDDLMVIEHDIVCRPDVVIGVLACTQPWCVWPYDNIGDWADMEAWRNELGCTRFSSQLIADVPNAVSEIGYRQRDWHNLCDGIATNLRAQGWSHHWHFPAVHHHRMGLAQLS